LRLQNRFKAHLNANLKDRFHVFVNAACWLAGYYVVAQQQKSRSMGNEELAPWIRERIIVK